MKTNRIAMSLVEVLVATVIIAVAIYGMILTLGAQQIAEGQLNQTKVLRQLHYQLIREVLKNQQDVNTPNLLATATGSPYQLANPALGQDAIYLQVQTQPYGAIQVVSTSTLYTRRNGNNFASSTIVTLLPYIGNWKNVKP